MIRHKQPPALKALTVVSSYGKAPESSIRLTLYKAIFKGTTMPKEEWGMKRVCPTTGKRFYDLNKNPIVSPYTGEIVEVDTSKTRMIEADAEDAANLKSKENLEGDDVVLDDDDDTVEMDLGDDVLDDDDDEDNVSLDDIADVASEEDES
jgi:uncharacterized protein (TIGR02300 family)